MLAGHSAHLAAARTAKDMVAAVRILARLGVGGSGVGFVVWGLSGFLKSSQRVGTTGCGRVGVGARKRERR